MVMDVALITKPLIPNQQLEAWHNVVSQKLYYSKVDDAIVQDIIYSEERERLRAQIVGE
jgi:predicted AlkP superfamily phosphohydrolase/phosphomutase